MKHLSALAFRNVRARPARTLLTMVGVVLGVAVVVGVSVMNRSIYTGYQTLFEDVAGSAQLTVETATRTEEGFDQQVLAQVQAVEGVRLAVPSTVNSTMLLLSDREVSLNVYGVDPAVDASLRPYRIVQGSFLEDESRHTVVVVEDLADKYDIEVGENVTLLGDRGPELLQVVGLMAKEGPARHAEMVMPLAVSQDIFGRRRTIDAIDIVAEERVARSASALERLKSALQDEVGISYQVLYPAAKADWVVQAMEGLSLGLSFYATIALFGGAYLVLNTFSMTVVERTREIGLLRAVGATKGQNRRLILIEALLLGLAGSTLGLGFGLLLAVLMTRLVGGAYGLTGWALDVPPGGLVAGGVTGLIVSLGSALIPALRAARISPIEALGVRGRQRSAGWLTRHGWKAGLALMAATGLISLLPVPDETMQMGVSQMNFLLLIAGITLLVPVITGLLERLVRPLIAVVYGNEGRIGAGNVNRAVGRTTITVGVLTMAVMMLVLFGSVTASMVSDVRDWMDAALQGDLFVTSFRPMRLDLARELATLQGVNLVTPMRLQLTKAVGATTAEGFVAHDDDLAFVAVDPLGYTQVSEFQFASGQGDARAMLERLMAGDAVFISTSIRQRYGIGKGDFLRLRTARGEQDLHVAGVIVDYTLGGWSVTGSWEDLMRYYRTDKASSFVVDVAPGYEAEQVRREMEAQYGKRRHIEVASGQEYRDRWLKEFTAMNALFDVIVAIGVIIAVLGVTNTVMMNVLERVREIGCLRAIGMTRGQVVRMVLAEALIVGLLGGLFGMAFGAYASFFAVKGMAASTGWELPFVLPVTSLLAGLAVALGVSQVASLYPAWRAAKTNIVRAVQYE